MLSRSRHTGQCYDRGCDGLRPSKFKGRPENANTSGMMEKVMKPMPFNWDKEMYIAVRTTQKLSTPDHSSNVKQLAVLRNTALKPDQTLDPMTFRYHL